MRFRFELDDTDYSNDDIKHSVVIEQDIKRLDDVLALFSLFMRSAGYFYVEHVQALNEQGDVITVEEYS